MHWDAFFKLKIMSDMLLVFLLAVIVYYVIKIHYQVSRRDEIEYEYMTVMFTWDRPADVSQFHCREIGDSKNYTDMLNWYAKDDWELFLEKHNDGVRYDIIFRRIKE